MTLLIVPLPGAEKLAATVAREVGAEIAEMSFRQFPDGESYVRFLTSPEGKDVIVLALLDHPDRKIGNLVFVADGARELRANSVGLIAPYLPYMRQDKRFRSGEVITSTTFAKLISAHFDWLMTIDPHLHRRASLDEIYAIPSTVLHAADLLADWIKENVKAPILIGPDRESEQWVSRVAAKLNCPFKVLSKIRHGDHDVEISVPDLNAWESHTPVIIDDTISSAQTMIESIRQIRDQGLEAPICCAVHGVFDGAALTKLKAAGPSSIITSNTVSCETALVDISRLIADAIQTSSYINCGRRTPVET